jgi:hypothetical protein
VEALIEEEEELEFPPPPDDGIERFKSEQKKEIYTY